MGAVPKPTALKILEGNPGKRPLPKNEPKPARGVPSVPRWLDKLAKSKFRELGKELDTIGVLTHVDRTALELLVDAYAEYRDARATLQEHGRYYETMSKAHGLVKKEHPAAAVADRKWSQVLKMLREFGLTPSSRTKVATVLEQDTGDDYFG